MVSCTQTPSSLELPAPSDPNISAAEQAFLKGDWDTLKALITRLPGEGANLSESLFYQAVTLGIDQAKRGAEKMKDLQVSGPVKVRERAALLYLVFKAQSGDCLLTEGALRRVYWPKAESLPQGSRFLLETALRGCDDLKRKSHDAVNAISEELKENSHSSEPSQTDQSVKESPSVEVKALDSKSELGSPKDSPSAGSHLSMLTMAERQSVSPYLQLWLPLVPSGEGTKPQPAGINTLLSESAPLLVNEHESKGERVTLERLDVSLEGEQSVSMRVAELRTEVDAIIAVTPNEDLHQAVISASKTYLRPLFMMTPFKFESDENVAKDHVASEQNTRQIWRIYPDLELITASLVKMASQAESQGVGVLIPEGPQGLKTLSAFKASLSAQGIQLIRHRALASDADWNQVATELRAWPVDTLIFASLPQLSITSLVTHLAAKGIWSAESKMFQEPLLIKAERADQDLYRRYLLWPSAYDQRTLDQAGRYLEGARTVTPVVRETAQYQDLDKRLRQEVGRGAELLDAIVLELLTHIDEAVRIAKVKQRELSTVLSEINPTLNYLKKLDFNQVSPLAELYAVEVHEQAFRQIPQEVKAPTEAPTEAPTDGSTMTESPEAKQSDSAEHPSFQ